MTPDAALDQVAFLVGLRLMGPDARRRLRLALMKSPDFVGRSEADIQRLEELDALLDGRREVLTDHDHYEIARAERDRAKPPFDEAFWLARSCDLTRAGFEAQQATQIIRSVRAGVEPIHQPTEQISADQSQA